MVSSSAIIALDIAMQTKIARIRLHVYCIKPSRFGIQHLVEDLGSLVAITLLSRRLHFWASRSTALKSIGITKNEEGVTGGSETMCYLYTGKMNRRQEASAPRLLATLPKNMVLAIKDIDMTL